MTSGQKKPRRADQLARINRRLYILLVLLLTVGKTGGVYSWGELIYFFVLTSLFALIIDRICKKFPRQIERFVREMTKE